MTHTNHTSAAEAVLRRMIDATNTEDRQAFLDCFAPDGVVDDFGRTFTGRAAIQQWSDTENIGTHNRISITAVHPNPDGTTLADITVSGDGYNGPGTFHVAATGTRISRLTIRGS
jgi:hypothetical protein